VAATFIDIIIMTKVIVETKQCYIMKLTGMRYELTATFGSPPLSRCKSYFTEQCYHIL